MQRGDYWPPRTYRNGVGSAECFKTKNGIFNASIACSAVPKYDATATAPKNFAKPLTCYFWSKYGYCSKSDEECIYAHYWTGVMAAAPINLASRGPVAGREAQLAISEALQRDEDYKTQEQDINRRNEKLNAAEIRTRRIAGNLRSVTEDLLEDLEAVTSITKESIDILKRYRDDLFASMDYLDGHGMSSGAAARTSNQVEKLDRVIHEMKAQNSQVVMQRLDTNYSHLKDIQEMI